MPPGINPVDWKIREGQLKEMIHQTFPLVLGWDVSGVVEALGPGVKRLKVGDEAVSAVPTPARDGAYAEFIVMKEAEVALLKPNPSTTLHAAALPLASLTAWQVPLRRRPTSSRPAGADLMRPPAASGLHLAVQPGEMERRPGRSARRGPKTTPSCPPTRGRPGGRSRDRAFRKCRPTGGRGVRYDWAAKPRNVPGRCSSRAASWSRSPARRPAEAASGARGAARAFVFTQPNAAP